MFASEHTTLLCVNVAYSRRRRRVGRHLLSWMLTPCFSMQHQQKILNSSWVALFFFFFLGQKRNTVALHIIQAFRKNALCILSVSQYCALCNNNTIKSLNTAINDDKVPPLTEPCIPFQHLVTILQSSHIDLIFWLVKKMLSLAKITICIVSSWKITMKGAGKNICMPHKAQYCLLMLLQATTSFGLWKEFLGYI